MVNGVAHALLDRVPLVVLTDSMPAAGRDTYQSCRSRGEGEEESDAITFVHSRTGLRTLKDEFEKVASHNEHHLGQIRKALGS